MIQAVPVTELVKLLRKRGEIAFRRDYALGFLEVVYQPPSTAGYQDGDTAETRLGGSSRSRNLTIERKYIPLVGSTGEPAVSLGRAETNDVVIDAFGISKRHASFSVDDQGNTWLRDLGSSNGTTVNGTPLSAGQPVQLFTGDAVTVWWYVFEFVYTKHLINSFRDVL